MADSPARKINAAHPRPAVGQPSALAKLAALALATLAPMAGAQAEIYGDFSTRIESRANFYRQAFDSSYGYLKYVYGQAYFRNDERPGWYGGFLLLQEWPRGTDPDTRGGANDVAIGYFGKFIKTHWGHMGYETSMGYESLSGARLRPRAYFQFDLNQSYYLTADIAYSYFGHQSRASDIDLDAHHLELKAGLHYRRAAHAGLFVSTCWRPGVLNRIRFGNIVEEQLHLRLGSWQNYARVETTVWLDIGGAQVFADTGREMFSRHNSILLGFKLAYEFVDGLRFVGSLSYERQWSKRGLWIPGGGQNVDGVSFDLGLKYSF